MAASARSDLNDEPARKLARLLLKRTGQTPPVDVDALLREKADVEIVADFPIPDGDAFVARIPGKRATVYVSARQAGVRRRFTLAHELGHLWIPWQTGTVVCHTGHSYVFHDYKVEQLEREANWFASELLLPTDWVRGRLKGYEDLAARVAEMHREARVSAPAAVLGIGPCCPGICALLLVNDEGEVRYHSKSPLAGANIARCWSVDEHKKMVDSGARVTVSSLGPSLLVAIEFPVPQPYVVPTKSAKEIKDTIIAGLRLDPATRSKLLNKIGGYIGAANSQNHGVSREVLRATLHSRFTNRDALLVEFVSHPFFNDFLDAVAAELTTRVYR